MVEARSGPSKLPLAWLTLALPIAVRTSSSESPCAASATGSTWMRMAGRWPPPRLTRPTPGASESLAARRVSTRSSTLVSGRVSELTARLRMGASAGLTLLYTGGIGRSVGRKELAALIAACSSCSAVSRDRKSTRLNSSHVAISYAVFCLKKKKDNVYHTHSNYYDINHKHPS